MIARKAKNQIERSGWKSSFSGELFSEKEMSEFAENVWLKLSPYMDADSRVIEIGVGSGIIAEKIAPYVKEYIGIDISSETLKKTKEMVRQKEIKNIKLMQENALTITQSETRYADIVIMNSVIQYFENYKEYAEVMGKLSDIIKREIVFVGDILDLAKKDNFLTDLKEHGASANKNDLWYSKECIVSIKDDIDRIGSVFITDKIGYTIQNELTKYRFDVIFEIQ